MNECYAGSVQSVQITTGNVLTVNDPFIATPPGQTQGQFGSPFGARNPLGCAAYISDGTIGTGTGRRWKVRYVRLNPTTPPASYIVGPVYWKDNTFQVVTTLLSESPQGANGVCGVLLNAQATASVLTGNYVFILVSGFLGVANLGVGVAIPTAAIAAGGLLYGNTGQQQFLAIAPGTARSNLEAGVLQTAVAGGVADIFVNIES